MSDAEIIHQVWNHCQNILGSEYKLYLFGSRASKKNDTYSDYDFFVRGKEPVPQPLWFKLTEAIQEIETLYKIDLVDYMRASEDFKSVAGKFIKEIVDGQIRY